MDRKGAKSAKGSGMRISGMIGRRAGEVAVVIALLLLATTSLWSQEIKTIRPGMTEAEVVTAWGQPMTVRKAGTRSYLYYRNDCLKRCGTYDIVFLEGGQVVDAVVRDRGRKYDGVASSPVERKPEPTMRP